MNAQHTERSLKRMADVALRIFLAIVLVSTMTVLPSNATATESNQAAVTSETQEAPAEDAAAETGSNPTGAESTEGAVASDDTTTSGNPATATEGNAPESGSTDSATGSTTEGTDGTAVAESPLATLLANIEAAGEDAAVNVTLRAGEHIAAVNFAGGWLADEAEAWELFDTYAANQMAQGKTAPAANEAFKPSIDAATIAVTATSTSPTAAETAYTSTLFTAVTNNNAYTSASIENVDGTPVLDAHGNTARVIALGSVVNAEDNTEIHYILNDGTEATLTDGQTIYLDYSAPTNEQLNTAQAASDEAAAAEAAAAEEAAANVEATEGEAATTENAAAEGTEAAAGEEATEEEAAYEPTGSLLLDLLTYKTTERVPLKVIAGDASNSGTFAGGLLVSDASAWNLSPTYAQKKAEQGEQRPEQVTNFKPEVDLGWFANGEVSSAVASGIYRGAYVEDAEGNRTEIIAAGYLEGELRYVSLGGSLSSVTEGQTIVLDFDGAHTTGGFLGFGAVNSLAALLNEAAQQEDASVPVTLSNGVAMAEGTFDGGLLISNEQATEQVPGYTGTETEEAAADFTSEAVQVEGTAASIQASVANNAYTGAFVGSEQVVAAATIDGRTTYATTSGAVKTLAEGEQLRLTYAASADTGATVQSSLGAQARSTTPVVGDILPSEGRIWKQWLQSIQGNKMGFQGGDINSSTVPSSTSDQQYWPRNSSTNAIVSMAATEAFRGAYVVFGATAPADGRGPQGGTRYQIDWLGEVDGEIMYRFATTTSGNDDAGIVITSRLGLDEYIIFHYDNTGQVQRPLTIARANANTVSGSITMLTTPTSINNGSYVTITARRQPGAALYLDENDFIEVVGVNDNTINAGANGYGFKGSISGSVAGAGNDNRMDVVWKVRLKSGVTVPEGNLTLTITARPPDSNTVKPWLRLVDLDRANSQGTVYRGMIDWRSDAPDAGITRESRTITYNGATDKFLNEQAGSFARGSSWQINWYSVYANVVKIGSSTIVKLPTAMKVEYTNAHTGQAAYESIPFQAFAPNTTLEETSWEYKFTTGDLAGGTVAITATVREASNGAKYPEYKFTLKNMKTTTTTLVVEYEDREIRTGYEGPQTGVQVNFDSNAVGDVRLDNRQGGANLKVSYESRGGVYLDPSAFKNGTNPSPGITMEDFNYTPFSSGDTAYAWSAFSGNTWSDAFGTTQRYSEAALSSGTFVQFNVKPGYRLQSNAVTISTAADAAWRPTNTKSPYSIGMSSNYDVNTVEPHEYREGVIYMSNYSEGANEDISASRRYMIWVPMSIYTTSVLNINTEPATSTVSFASNHEIQGGNGGTLPDSALYRTIGRPTIATTPSAENASLTLPIAPENPISYNDVEYYFQGWKVNNSSTIYPAEHTFSDVFAATGAGRGRAITITGVFVGAPTFESPQEATYTLKVRDDDKQYRDVSLAVTQVQDGSYSVVATNSIDSSISSVLNGLTGTWDYRGYSNSNLNAEGSYPSNSLLQDDVFGTFGGNKYGNNDRDFPYFVYEHQHRINFMTDANPEGPGGGGNTDDNLDGVTQSQITGTAPNSSDGYSWDKVVLTPAGAFPLSADGTVDESTLDFTPAYTLEGYELIGWRGTGSNNLFLFDPTGYEIDPTTGLHVEGASAVDPDNNPTYAVIERQWGTMNLEPVWAKGASYVVFSIAGGPTGLGIGATQGSNSSEITAARANRFHYELTTAEDGTKTIGRIPAMKNYNDGSGSIYITNYLVDFWPLTSATSTALNPNYIAGWTALNTENQRVLVSSTTDVSTLSDANIQTVTTDTGSTITAYVLEPVWINRSFNPGLGVNNTIATGSVAVTGSTNNGSTQVTGATLAQNSDTEWTLSGTIPTSSSNISFPIQIIADNVTNTPENTSLSDLDGVAAATEGKMQPRVVSSSNADGSSFSGTIGNKGFGTSWGAGTGGNNVSLTEVDSDTQAVTFTLNLLAAKANVEGNYTLEVPITLDAGSQAGGWNYTKQITLHVDLQTQRNDWDLDIADVDYVNETIVVAGADAVGATVTGATDVTTVPGNSQVPLTSSLDAWENDGAPIGTATSTVTISRDRGDTGFYQPESYDVVLPHRPQAPSSGENGNMTITHNVISTESDGTQSSPNGSISITPRGTETYQYRQGTTGDWQSAGNAVDGVITISNLGSATDNTSYQVRVAPTDNGVSSDAGGTFASDPVTVTIERYYPIHYEFVMNDAYDGDLDALVQERLTAYANDSSKTEGNRNAATEALATLFNNNPNETIRHGATVAAVRDYWVPLNAIMEPGYTFTTTVQVGNGEPTVHSACPTTNPTASAETTITYTWTRVSGTLNYDYNFSDGILNGHFRGDLRNPDLWESANFIIAPGQTLSQITSTKNANGETRTGAQLLPEKDGWSFSTMEFWDTGYKFEGWWTGDGTEGGPTDPIAGNWGLKTGVDTPMSDILPGGGDTATLYARWAPVTYDFASSNTTSSQPYTTTGDYQPITGTLTVTNNEGTQAADGTLLGVADPRVRELRITQVTGPNGENITNADEIARYFTLTTTASTEAPTEVNDGMQITVQPVANADMTQGEWTATVSIGYDGGANNTSLDLGGNVYTIDAPESDSGNQRSDKSMTFTLNVQPAGSAHVQFGDIDYENETVIVMGAQAPTSVAEAVAWAGETLEDGSKRLAISGLPADFDLTNEANWEYTDNTLKLKLTAALDSNTGNWATPNSTTLLTLTVTPPNFTEVTSPKNIASRPAAPTQASNSDPRAKGAGQQGTVTMSAPPHTSDVYMHRTAAANGAAAGSWQSMSGGTPTQFSAVAGNYEVRVNGSNVTGNNHFASRPMSVTIEQWYKVEIAVAGTDWQGNAINDMYNVTTSDGGHTLGQQIGRYTGNGAMVAMSNQADGPETDIRTLNQNDRGWSTYAGNAAEPEGGVYDSMYVPANGLYKLPVFGDAGAADGNVPSTNWETPGYNLTSITQQAVGAAEATTIAGAGSATTNPYQATASQAITGDTTITLNFTERRFTVAWSVTSDLAGTVENDPTTQLVPWSEMVKTSMLGNMDEVDFGDTPNAVTDWFVDVDVLTAVKDPIHVGFTPTGDDANKSVVRDTWALYTNNNDGNNRVGFQVAQRMSRLADFDPRTHLAVMANNTADPDGDNTRPAPKSWRDANTITFNTHYSEDQGVYGIRFKIAPQDQALFSTTNEDQYSRLSVSNSKTAPVSSDVRLDRAGASAVSQNNTVIPGSTHVFSGWFVDPATTGSTLADGNNMQELGTNTGAFYNTSYTGLTNPTRSWSTDETVTTTEQLINALFNPDVTVSEYADSNVTGLRVEGKNVRPFFFSKPFWDQAGTTTGSEGGSSGQYADGGNYRQFFDTQYNPAATYPVGPSGSGEGVGTGKAYIASDAKTYPLESRLDVTARIENANLNYTNSLPQVANETDGVVQQQTGEITLTPEALWTGTKAAEASATTWDSSQVVGFRLVNVTQTDSTRPSGTGNWLEIRNATAGSTYEGGLSFRLETAENLTQGSYSTNLQVEYEYQSTTNSRYTFTKTIPVTFQVGSNAVTSGNWMAVAYDYATTHADALNTLNTTDGIAQAMGLTVYYNTSEDSSNPTWEEATFVETGGQAPSGEPYYQVTSTNPEPYSATNAWSTGPHSITLGITGTDASNQTASITHNRNSISLYDGGGLVSDNIAVFANDIDMTLPDKDLYYRDAASTAEGVTYLDGLMDVTAYNVGTGYTEITDATFTITNDSNLRTAGPDAVAQSSTAEATNQFDVTFSHGTATGTATVTLVKADLPGAPGAFTWTRNASSYNSVAWTAAPLHEGLAIAGKYSYAPTVNYEVVGGETPTTHNFDTTTATGLDSNTQYTVRAYHALPSDSNAALVYNATADPAGYTNITGDTVWTRPMNPNNATYGLNIGYDYANKTVVYTTTPGNTPITLPYNFEEGTQSGNASAATVTVDDGLTDTNTVATLAGVQQTSRAGASGAGLPSGTFVLTATGTQSTLAASGVQNLRVPQNAQTPALSIEQPAVITDPAVITGFDPEYVAAGTGPSLETQYQVRFVNNETEEGWGSIAFTGETANITQGGTITVDLVNGQYQFEIPAAYVGEALEFRVVSSDQSFNSASTLTTVYQNGAVPAHFASEVQSTPVSGGSAFNIVLGADISAQAFKVGLDELTAWGFDPATDTFTNEDGFINAALSRSNPTVTPETSTATVAIDTASYASIELTEGGPYSITWNLMDADGTELKSINVDMTVTSSYSPGTGTGEGAAWLSANDFVIGLSEVGSWDALTSLAWTRSGAEGANVAGTALNAANITFTVDGATTIDELTASASPYTVHFANTEMGLNASVLMYVADNASATTGENWIITSNNFSVGENEVDSNQVNGELTEAAALVRAGVQLFEVGTAVTPVAATTSNVTVSLTGIQGATVAQSPVVDGATFTVTDANTVSTASDVTIKTSGSGSAEGAYQLNASDIVTDVASLTANASNGAALLYELAGVNGVNNSTPISADGYDTTWTVTMAAVAGSNTANPTPSVTDKTTWTKGEYTLTFSLLGDGATAYTATVSMTVADKGGSGTVDNTTYYITSNDFEAGVEDYATYFPADSPNATALISAADVQVYEQRADGTRILVSDLNTAGLHIDVTASAITESSFVAGATAGPVVFTLNNTEGNLTNAPSTQSMIKVHGGYTEGGTEGGTNFTLTAENFIVELADLAGVTSGTAMEATSAFAMQAVSDSRFTISPESATALTSVTVGSEGDILAADNTYPVTFTVTGGATVTVQMTVYDSVAVQDGYVIAANSFRASEAEAATAANGGISTQEIRVRAKVAVYNVNDLQTPVLAWNSPGSRADIWVTSNDFRNHTAGQASWIVFTYTPSGVQVTSNVDIYASGGTGSEGSGSMSLYSSDIVVSKDEIPTQDSDVAAWLIGQAGVTGTDYAGDSLDSQTEVTTSINTVADVVDGATVTFSYSEEAENATGTPTTYTVQAQSTITIREVGGEQTGNDGQIYGIYANSINATVAEGTTLANATSNYQNLRNATGVVGYVKANSTAPARALTANEIVVDAAQAATLANAYDGAVMNVTFTNGPSQTAVTEGTLTAASTATSAINFYTEGSSTSEYELYANDFKVGREQLTGAVDAAAIEQLIRTGSNVVWGPNTDTSALTIELASSPANESTTWQNVADFMTATGFDNWGATAYDVRFTYTGVESNPTIVVTMGVSSDYNQTGTAEVSASDFSVTKRDVDATIEDYRAQLISWAGAQALDNKVAANDRMTVQLDDVEVAAGATKPANWPSAEGLHEVTFSITEAVPTGENGTAQTATVTVAMAVFDNGSTDPIDPNEPITPNPGITHLLVSNDFELSLEDIAAGKDSTTGGFTEAFQAELIERAGAKAYLLGNLAVESGTVYVYNANELLATDLAEGDTVRIAFGVRDDVARSVSTVTIYKSGGADDTPDSQARIYANDVHVWQSVIDNPTTAGFTDLTDMLLTLSGANGTLTDGTAMAAENFSVNVVTSDGQGGTTTAAPSTDNLVDGATLRFTHNPAIMLTDSTTLMAEVTLHVTDNGGSATDPNPDPDTGVTTTYRMQSDNISWLANNVAQLTDNTNNYNTLRTEANARATMQVADQPEQVLNGWDDTKLNVDASALGTGSALPAGTYNVVFTNTASSNETVRPQSTSVVTLYDQGGVSSDTQDYLWANNFTTTTTELTNGMTDIHDFIYNAAGISAGNDATGEVQNRKDVGMTVDFNGTAIDLVAHANDLAGQTGFDNWVRDSYTVSLSYGNQNVSVTMTVRDDGVAPDTSNKASIYANDFAVAQATLEAQTTVDTLGAFLYSTSGARITGTDATGAALPRSWDPNLVSIAINGETLTEPVTSWAIGTYPVTFTVMNEGASTGKSVTIDMTVKTALSPGEGGAWLSANNFTVGLSEVTNWNSLTQLAWNRSGAHGENADGVALTASDITFEVEGAAGFSDLSPAESPYTVHFVNNELGLYTTVQMAVFDNAEEGTNWIIMSNDFSAGENEVDSNQENGDLTEAAALARAGVQLFAIDDTTTPVEATTSNVTVDLTGLTGKTVADSPVANGVVFTAVEDTAATTASTVTITSSGSGSEDALYQLNASDIVTDVASLATNINDGTALLYELAGVSGVNNNTPINADGYGTTWTVTMAAVNTAGLNVANPSPSVTDKTTWTKGEYTLVFSLLGEGATAYTATVSMTVADKGASGNVDGTTYYITSNDFKAGVADYATYFPSGDNPDHSALIAAAGVQVYEQRANGMRIPVSDLAAAGLAIDVNTSAVTEDVFVAGATVGPVVFTLNNTEDTLENAPRTEVLITVQGDYVEGDGFSLTAGNFVVALSDLAGVTPGTAITGADLSSGFAAKAVAGSNFTIDPEGATTLASVTAGTTGGTFASGNTYPVTFTVNDADRTSIIVQMTVYDHATTQEGYVVVANDFRASETEAALQTEVGALTMQQLRERAKVAVYSENNLQTPVVSWDSTSSVNDIVVYDTNLRGRTAGQDASVMFRYAPTGSAATSNVTIYAEGSATDTYELYANDFKIGRAQLVSSNAATIEGLIRENSRVVWGPNTSTDALRIEVANSPAGESATWQSVADLVSEGSFAWDAEAYDVRFTYTGVASNPTAVVTMTVTSNHDQAGTVEISAGNFSVSLSDLNGTINDYRMQLISWAGARAFDNNTAANDRIVVELDGEEVSTAKPSTWPSAEGVHQVAFSITEQTGTGTEGTQQTAEIVVDMTVFENGSTDPIDPEDPINPNPGQTHLLVSNNFSLTLASIEAGKTEDGTGFTPEFQAELIELAGAKAYLLSDPSVEAGTVYVANASELLGDLAEGDTARIAFGVEGDTALAVSTVTIYTAGSEDDTPNSKASIYANDVHVWQSVINNPVSGGFTSLTDMLLTLSGANGTLADGTAMTETDFTVSVLVDNGQGVVTEAVPSADNLVNGATVRFTHNPAITLADNTTLAADVTLHVTDSGNESTDPETNTTYRMQSNNVALPISDIAMLRDAAGNYAALRGETGARATLQVEGQAEQLINGADETKVRVDASALGTTGTLPAGDYTVTFTNTASGNESIQPQSMSTITLYDQGTVNPDTKNYLWANNFTTTQAALTGGMLDIHNFIYSAARVSAGNEVTGAVQNRKDVGMTVDFGGTNIDLVAHATDLASQPGFDNWARDSYTVTLTYGGETTTITMTVRDGGSGPGDSGEDAKASIYGSEFSVGRGTLSQYATADALGAFLYGADGAKIAGTDTTGAPLPNTWDANLVSITVNGNSLADAIATGWPIGDYQVVFTVLDADGTPTSKRLAVSMSVKDQADTSADGSILVAANGFSTGVASVSANANNRAQWIWGMAKAVGVLDNQTLNYNDPSVSITMGGTAIDQAVWPTTHGLYSITITVGRTGSDTATSGANAATVTVDMNVFDNSSTDPADGITPEPVNDGRNDVLTYDFTVTTDELAASTTALTNEVLISRASARVVEQNNPGVVSGTVEVVSRSHLDAGTLKAGDTTQVAFRMVGGVAVATATVTVLQGSEPEPTPDPTKDEIDIYRLYNPNSGLHHYTTDMNEVRVLVSLGWRDEGPAFRVHRTLGAATYRAYNPNNGTHNWTMDLHEQTTIVGMGWNDEGIAWYIPDYAQTPVYRLYNTSSYEHLYTTDKHEYDVLVALGWRGENIGWYSI